ncbi:hypothetical protein RND71_041626 [Anisodus tanguticus]|uniref:Uncharacterized protein n=1 Tax=Anisodus tanguticus TaxID=243964 RepID=A0AAE1UWV9_9SOLA|nr:hypothetical protein RND71_041626 [Anisodus tanguticus]
MEGLIPFLFHAMKKQKPNNNSFRCLSDTSNRSYHMLVGADSVEGSSHRRTRSEFQPPVTVDFLDVPQPRSFNNRTSSLLSPVPNKNGSRFAVTLQLIISAIGNSDLIDCVKKLLLVLMMRNL